LTGCGYFYAICTATCFNLSLKYDNIFGNIGTSRGDLMLRLLKPALYIDSVSLIPIKELQIKGISGLIIDLDNTITEWAGETVNPEIEQWLCDLSQSGIKTCIVSNNHRQRVSQVAGQLGVSYVFNAGKPRRKAFRQAMDLLGTSPGETAVVGDQIFTDVLGGNRLGLLTILVMPISPKEFISTQLVRKLERMVLRYLKISQEVSR
jgi:HAD superfamily phosphatase (TIGR01668 family)